eukprot:scaffold23767_cov22-Tisochrysis_lutea.AAC.1
MQCVHVIHTGETGLLSHASCNRQELCALTEAVLASMAKADAVATPAAAAAAGTASGPRGPALAQAQAEEVPRARNALWPPAQNEQSLWPLVQDEQLWSWATQASGMWGGWVFHERQVGKHSWVSQRRAEAVACLNGVAGSLHWRRHEVQMILAMER